MGDLTQNFSKSEFACKCGCGGPRPNVLRSSLILKLQRLREATGWCITVLSGFRCYEHNLSVGGNPQSYHLYGMAADIICAGCTLDRLAELASGIGFSGIGIYRAKHFIHLDIGEERRWEE